MEYSLRRGTAADLPAVNHIIEAAVMSWRLAERVKRLSLPSYRYDAADLMHLTLWLVEDTGAEREVVAVAGWEPADAADLPAEAAGLLLHGLYVRPERHGQGVGQRLLKFVEHHAAETGYGGVLVKAQVEAIGFFQQHGYWDLPVADSERHYMYRMWKNIDH